MRIFRRIVFLIFLLCAGCSLGGDANMVAPLPYLTAAPSPTYTPLPRLTEIILPTPTPFGYTIVQGDTLSGVAMQFDVSLEALIAANPGIIPTSLQVGTTLVIPIGDIVSGELTPTPASLSVCQARCWVGAEGGMYCFALFKNVYTYTLENISAQFTLLDSSGKQVDSLIGYAPLNILPAGEEMPIVVYFAQPEAADLIPRVEVLTAFRLLPSDQRYLPVKIHNYLVSGDDSSRIASVSGYVEFPAQSGAAKTLWILGVGYDLYGNVVGLRRWESSSPLTAGGSTVFAFTVASVGPKIERVKLLVEARP